jgi:uncharacterized membrane protein
MEQVTKSDNLLILGLGLLIILIAIVVGVYKQTWLIAGVNTMSREKKARFNLDYLCKFVGWILGVLGGLMVVGMLVCAFFDILDYYNKVMPFVVIGLCAYLILSFYVFNKKKFYIN